MASITSVVGADFIALLIHCLEQFRIRVVPLLLLFDLHEVALAEGTENALLHDVNQPFAESVHR